MRAEEAQQHERQLNTTYKKLQHTKDHNQRLQVNVGPSSH